MRIAIITKYHIFLLTLLMTLTIFFLLFIRYNDQNTILPSQDIFNSEKAYDDIQYQISLGARTPESVAHENIISWIDEELNENGWETEIQSTNVDTHHIQNIVGKKGSGRPWIILGVHYDSRIYADRDELASNRLLPVPGANDGASGVAILLELSRCLTNEIPDKTWAKEVWLVFFDAEDNGDIDTWQWIMGSTSFAENLQSKPDLVVILDMVGDADLNIHMERNSDNYYSQEIWDTAAELGYEEYFIPEFKYNIIDDHIPFIRKGIPAVDIIDIDYPYWHTTQDTADKVSAQSLSIVGTTIYTWLTKAAQP